MEALAIAWRFSTRKLRVIIRPIQKVFGFSVIRDTSSQKIIDLSTYLTETDTKISELPKSYRDLFKNDSDIDDELFVNTSNNIHNLKKVYEAWAEGVSTNAAIIGERGSGKSTLIHTFQKTLPEDLNILNVNIEYSTWKEEQALSFLSAQFDIKDVKRPETLVRAINDQKESRVVFIEGLQNLYLRNINGFDALEILWLVISETKENIFWVVSCSRYAWDFLSKAKGVETHFTHLFYTDLVSDEQMFEVIMSRHDKSAYRLLFEPDESTRKSRAYRKRLHKPAEAQEYLKKEFFNRLTEISKGNISVAILLWLRSIKKVEGRTITILPFNSADIESLDLLTSEVLFVLASLLLHDSLRVAELCRVMNISLSESRVLLSRLKSRGILLESNGLYRVNQLVFRQVIRMLKKRNIVH